MVVVVVGVVLVVVLAFVVGMVILIVFVLVLIVVVVLVVVGVAMDVADVAGVTTVAVVMVSVLVVLVTIAVVVIKLGTSVSPTVAHINLCPKSKFIRNPSQIDQKTAQIDENTSLERFRHQIAPRSAPGRSGQSGVLHFLRFFEILFGFMGPFSAPWEIADRSKIVLLSIDGHFDPRKMPSGSGFGKHMKIA